MNFINYSTAILPNLNYNQQIILQPTVHTLYVNSITICNRSTNDIRVSLVKKIIGTDSSSTQAFIAEEVRVEPKTSGKMDSRNTINLVSLFGLGIYLPVTIIGAVTYTTQLICYSNGIIQNFDCIVDYTAFVETPITA